MIQARTVWHSVWVLFCMMVLGSVKLSADLIMYDEFDSGLDTTTKWTVTGYAYPRSGYGDGKVVELAASYNTGQIQTQTADFTLPTPEEIGDSLTVQINYFNLNKWSHGYISICEFELLGTDDGSDYSLKIRSWNDNETKRWQWWDGSKWTKTNVAIAAAVDNATQWVRLTLTNVDGMLVPSACVSNDNGATWITVFTGAGQNSVWPTAVKLRLYENWGSCWINDVYYENLQAVKTPAFNPDGDGYIAESQLVEISCSTPDAEIRYTLDGGIPTQESFLYDDVQKVTVAPGQTLSARAFAPGFAPSPIKTAVYKAFNNPVYIPRADGSVNIDGNLSEWQASEFVPLMCTYSRNPQLESAAYAVRWDGLTNQFYMAVKVKDLHPIFSDGYLDWKNQDYIEAYVHTTGEGDLDYEAVQDVAQQYVLGLNATRTNPTNPAADIWKTFAGSYSISDELATQIGFKAAGVESVDEFGDTWLVYEVQMTAYHYMDKNMPANSVVSPLAVGDVVGVDVTVADKWGSGDNDFGMKSENLMLTKHADWTHIGVHKLAMHPADFDGDGKFSSSDIDMVSFQIKNGLNDPAFDLTGDNLVDQSDMDVLVLTLLQSRYGDANCDGSVDVGDLGILAANYGGTDKSWSQGDFNGDGKVDVGDLGILAANYGASRSSFEADYAKVFGAATVDEKESSNSLCSGLGLPMIAGLVLMGLMLVKLEE